MKYSILIVALAMLFVLPMAGGAYSGTGDLADITRHGAKLADGQTEICRLNRGNTVRIVHEMGNLTRVLVLTGPCIGKSGDVRSNHYEITLEEWEVVTNGKWGQKIPVFQTRQQFFAARDRHNYQAPEQGGVQCEIKVGTKVLFVPYRDWGVGEIKLVVSGEHATNAYCRGWFDRSLLR